jgi:alkylhydroperoxidase/carboxymuconolactone decarboxylase family protein YurZ
MTAETLFENQTSVIARDLKLNLNKFLESGSLSREDAHLALLAAAAAVKDPSLIAYATEQLQTLGFDTDQIREAPCTKSHEKALKDAGLTADKIHDLERIASIVKGLSFLA